jgi:hypothetical protein
MRGNLQLITTRGGREMHEQYKIGEAKFYLAKMEASIGDRAAFRYYLSAFLSAARSVIQYAWKGSEDRGRLDWYDATVAGNEVLSFFKDKRDVNIHGEPVDPVTNFTIPLSEFLGGGYAVSGVYFKDNIVEVKLNKEEPSPPKPPESSEAPESRAEATLASVRYRFNDWPGPEDVIGLSRRYVEELEKFVQKGTEIGIISG